MLLGILLIISGIFIYLANNDIYNKQLDEFQKTGITNEQLSNQISGSFNGMTTGISLTLFGLILIGVGIYIYIKPEDEFDQNKFSDEYPNNQKYFNNQ